MSQQRLDDMTGTRISPVWARQREELENVALVHQLARDVTVLSVRLEAITQTVNEMALARAMMEAYRRRPLSFGERVRRLFFSRRA